MAFVCVCELTHPPSLPGALLRAYAILRSFPQDECWPIAHRRFPDCAMRELPYRSFRATREELLSCLASLEAFSLIVIFIFDIFSLNFRRVQLIGIAR